jgi:hypothetical protein
MKIQGDDLMGVSVELDMQAIGGLIQAALHSAEVAVEQVRADLINAKTMPFDKGNMQNNQTFVAKNDDGASLVTGSPQARRLYYHPEYNFQQGKNENAGAYWLEPYLTGEKSDLAQNAFAEDFKRRTGV